MIPEECKMPDISDLDFPVKKYLIIMALTGDPGLTRKEGLFIRNFARLIDKSIKEYNAARKLLISHIEEAKQPVEQVQAGRFLYILDFTDNFENCINAVNRLLDQVKLVTGKSGRLEIEKNTRRRLEAAHGDAVNSIRNIAEHMDKQIHSGGIAIGQTVMFSVSKEGDKAGLGSREIEFSKVALTIRILHQIALDLLSKKGSS